MIKKNLPKLIITSLVILIPIIIGLILWNKLPEQMPIHWDIHGNVDGYSSKTMAVFAMPLFLLFIHWICVFATSADPKKQNINAKTFSLVLWISPLLSLICNSLDYASAMGYKLDVSMFIPLFMGTLFIVIGNYLPKCKQSYTMGIKLPWTLDNEENWNKTHRFAGFLWVIGGIIMLITSFLRIVWVPLIITFPLVFIPTIYSFIIYKNNKKSNK